MIYVPDISDSLFDAAWAALNELLYLHENLDVWRMRFDVAIPGEDTLEVYHGDMYVLVELNMSVRLNQNFAPSSSSQALHPYDVAHQIPGFISIGREKRKIIFAARFDHCNFCKMTKFDDFTHRYKECKERLCSYCGDPGHPRRSCPEARQTVSEKDQHQQAAEVEKESGA